MEIERFPVIIAGAGPAGSTLARLLSLRRMPVLLIDPGAAPHGRLELVAPRSVPLLLAAGLGEVLWDPSISGPCRGIRRTWHGVTSEEDFQDQQPGWARVIDRALLDAALVRLAELAGAVVTRGRVASVAAGVGGGTEVRVDDGRCISGDFIVDATGRAASVARRLGARRIHAERRLAVRDRCHPADDGFLWIAGDDDEWRYALTGPGGSRDGWTIGSPRSGHRRPGLKVDASSSRLDRFSGAGWLAVGDASLCFDPIASQGLGHAMAGALAAAGKLLRSRQMSDQDRHAYALLNLETWAMHGARHANASG